MTDRGGILNRLLHHSVVVSWVLFGLGCSGNHACASGQDQRPSPAAGSFALTRDGAPASVIVLGERATWVERHAAEELARYVWQMSGATLPILVEDTAAATKEANRILIGRPETHQAIEHLVHAGKVMLSPDHPGLDGFIIKSLADDTGRALVLGGSVDHATLYAVYDLLERFGNVGFNRYLERVPRVGTFVVPPADIAERPRFRYRIFGGQIAYFGWYWWSLEDWKQEMDWYAKRRINMVHFLPFGTEPVKNKVLEDMFGTPYRPGPNDARYHANGKEVAEYAARLGVSGVIGIWDGRVTEEFREQHPDGRYIEIQIPGHPREICVHPADPLYRQIVQAFVGPLRRAYPGTRFFFFPDPLSERIPPFDEAEMAAYRTSVAEALNGIMEDSAGDITWVMITWGWLGDERVWPKASLPGFFRSFPEDAPMVIWDLRGSRSALYKDTEYWYGRPWAFVPMGAYAFDGYLHGDMAGLLGRVREIVTDPRGKSCMGLGMMPELRDYFPLYLDLTLKLAWKPGTITMDSYLEDYVRRRYEPASGPAMTKVMRVLADTVYTAKNWDAGDRLRGEPHYQLSPGVTTVKFDIHRELVQGDGKQRSLLKEKEDFPRRLAQALELALGVADTERGNRSYERDLVDICRATIKELFNQHLQRLVDAYRQGDEEVFEREAEFIKLLLRGLLDAVAGVSDRYEYGLQPLIEKAPEAATAWDVNNSYSAAQMRFWQVFVTMSGYKIYNYHRVDRYEMIRDVYMPKIDFFIDTLRVEMKQGRRDVPEARLSEGYNKIEDRFLTDPGPAPKKGPAMPAEAVRRVLNEIKEKSPLKQPSP